MLLSDWYVFSDLKVWQKQWSCLDTISFIINQTAAISFIINQQRPSCPIGDTEPHLNYYHTLTCTWDVLHGRLYIIILHMYCIVEKAMLQYLHIFIHTHLFHIGIHPKQKRISKWFIQKWGCNRLYKCDIWFGSHNFLPLRREVKGHSVKKWRKYTSSVIEIIWQLQKEHWRCDMQEKKNISNCQSWWLSFMISMSLVLILLSCVFTNGLIRMNAGLANTSFTMVFWLYHL